MREIGSHEQLLADCRGDRLCIWAAQGLDGRSRAWASADGKAVAVAGPELSTRDRIAVHGPAESVVPLVLAVLDEVGPTFRPLGEPGVIDAVAAADPQLSVVGSFGWMDRTEQMTASGSAVVSWLDESELPEAAEVLAVAHPHSDARPGMPGVEGWAGARDRGGRLLAVAALAWSAPTLGFIAGVGVRPDARGQGLGRDVCSFVVAAALGRHGAAGLMVDEENLSAQRLYRGLGLHYRPLRAAAVTRTGR